MIALTAIIRARAGHEAAMRRALLEVVAHVTANEPGTVSYYVSQSDETPQVFTTYERYADRAAMERHNGSPAVARFFEIAKPILDGPAIVHFGAEIGAK